MSLLLVAMFTGQHVILSLLSSIYTYAMCLSGPEYHFYHSELEFVTEVLSI